MHDSAYGLWILVAFNSAIFILFAFSFFKPKSGRDWRSFGAFSAFLVALFTEMYGFPLTIYFLSGWLQSNYPSVDWFAHDSGHLLEMLFGWRGNPHFGPFHLLSFGLIGGGFILLSAAWRVLYQAQKGGHLQPKDLMLASATRNMSVSSSSCWAFWFSGRPYLRWPCSRSSSSCTGGCRCGRSERHSPSSANAIVSTQHAFPGFSRSFARSSPPSQGGDNNLLHSCRGAVRD